MANGRLGAKCIPAYKSCEVYQNSSGSEASVSIVTQGLDSSVDNTFTVSAASTQYCINPSRCEGHVGTNCYVDTAALTIAGTARTELHGAFISSSGTLTVGSCTARYPNITSYINPCDGTKTSIAGTSICCTCSNSLDHGRSPSCCAFTNGPIAPYGGNEVILPVEGMMRNMRCSDYGQCSQVTSRLSCMSCDFFMKYDCNTRGVLIINSRFYCCCYQCAGALFIDPSSGCGFCGYPCQAMCWCSMFWMSYRNEICCICEMDGCQPRWLATINHYSLGMYHPCRTSNLSGGVRLYCGSCCLYFCCWNDCQCTTAAETVDNACSAQAMISGFVSPGDSSCRAKHYAFSLSCPIQRFHSNCCYFTFSCGMFQCACPNKTSASNAIEECGGSSGCRIQYCCDGLTGNLYSPYGFQRGATYGFALMHTRTCNDARAIYFAWDPIIRFGQPNNCLMTVNWNAFRIKVRTNGEYPVKWLAHNPNPSVEKTYFMSRAQQSDNCGIFEYDWHEFHCYSGREICDGANCKMLNICYGCCEVMSNFCKWICSCRITKVADFPSIMLCDKYTIPQMCVGCLYRMGTQLEPFWSMSIYNHDTTSWDRFTTDDLLNWTNIGSTFCWSVSTTCGLTANDSCIVSVCNAFASAVPKCNYMDFDVSANNYERTGVVLSDGDSLYVNNCTSSAALAVQVWGYEG